MPRKARTSPNNSAAFSALPPVAFSRSCKTPENPSALIAASPLAYPFAARSSVNASVGLRSPVRTPLSCTVAVSAPVPCLPIVAIAAPTSLILTPSAAAAGVTVARLCARSSKVNFEMKTIWKRSFIVAVASLAVLPYAPRVEISTSDATAVVVIPAVAPIAASLRMSMASAAEYPEDTMV